MSHPFGVVTLWEFGFSELARAWSMHARQQLPAQRARVVCRVEDGRTPQRAGCGGDGADVAGGGARRTVLDV